jgi:hypothetical protein
VRRWRLDRFGSVDSSRDGATVCCCGALPAMPPPHASLHTHALGPGLMPAPASAAGPRRSCRPTARPPARGNPWRRTAAGTRGGGRFRRCGPLLDRGICASECSDCLHAVVPPGAHAAAGIWHQLCQSRNDLQGLCACRRWLSVAAWRNGSSHRKVRHLAERTSSGTPHASPGGPRVGALEMSPHDYRLRGALPGISPR